MARRNFYFSQDAGYKYSPEQERDPDGKFSRGGGSEHLEKPEQSRLGTLISKLGHKQPPVTQGEVNTALRILTRTGGSASKPYAKGDYEKTREKLIHDVMVKKGYIERTIQHPFNYRQHRDVVHLSMTEKGFDRHVQGHKEIDAKEVEYDHNARASDRGGSGGSSPQLSTPGQRHYYFANLGQTGGDGHLKVGLPKGVSSPSQLKNAPPIQQGEKPGAINTGYATPKTSANEGGSLGAHSEQGNGRTDTVIPPEGPVLDKNGLTPETAQAFNSAHDGTGWHKVNLTPQQTQELTDAGFIKPSIFGNNNHILTTQGKDALGVQKGVNPSVAFHTVNPEKPTTPEPAVEEPAAAQSVQSESAANSPEFEALLGASKNGKISDTSGFLKPGHGLTQEHIDALKAKGLIEEGVNKWAGKYFTTHNGESALNSGQEPEAPPESFQALLKAKANGEIGLGGKLIAGHSLTQDQLNELNDNGIIGQLGSKYALTNKGQQAVKSGVHPDNWKHLGPQNKPEPENLDNHPGQAILDSLPGEEKVSALAGLADLANGGVIDSAYDHANMVNAGLLHPDSNSSEGLTAEGKQALDYFQKTAAQVNGTVESPGPKVDPTVDSLNKLSSLKNNMYSTYTPEELANAGVNVQHLVSTGHLKGDIYTSGNYQKTSTGISAVNAIKGNAAYNGLEPDVKDSFDELKSLGAFSKNNVVSTEGMNPDHVDELVNKELIWKDSEGKYHLSGPAKSVGEKLETYLPQSKPAAPLGYSGPKPKAGNPLEGVNVPKTVSMSLSKLAKSADSNGTINPNFLSLKEGLADKHIAQLVKVGALEKQSDGSFKISDKTAQYFNAGQAKAQPASYGYTPKPYSGSSSYNFASSESKLAPLNEGEYRDFNSGNRSISIERSEKFEESLTPDEQFAVRSYTYHGDVRYNGLLRGDQTWATDFESTEGDKYTPPVSKPYYTPPYDKNDQAGALKAWNKYQSELEAWRNNEDVKAYTASYNKRNASTIAANENLFNERIATIDAALDKSTIPENTILYRGINFVNPTWEPGSVVSDPGFASSSISRDVSQGSAFAGTNGTLFRISAPKGTRGAFIQSMSQVSGEQEVLLGRNTKWVIDKIEHPPSGHGHTIIHAHII